MVATEVIATGGRGRRLCFNSRWKRCRPGQQPTRICLTSGSQVGNRKRLNQASRARDELGNADVNEDQIKLKTPRKFLALSNEMITRPGSGDGHCGDAGVVQ